MTEAKRVSETYLEFVRDHVRRLETVLNHAVEISGAQSIDEPDYKGSLIRLQFSRKEWDAFVRAVEEANGAG